MKKAKPRLDKKRHKYWLEYGVIDLSQRSEWRRKLFEAEEGEVFRISADALGKWDTALAAAMRKYRLRFSVSCPSRFNSALRSIVTMLSYMLSFGILAAMTSSYFFIFMAFRNGEWIQNLRGVETRTPA